MNQLEQGQAETQELEERLSHGQRLREQAEVQQEREGQELKAHWQGKACGNLTRNHKITVSQLNTSSFPLSVLQCCLSNAEVINSQ